MLDGDPASALSSAYIVNECVPWVHDLVHLDEDNAAFPSTIITLVLSVDGLHKHFEPVVRLPHPRIVGPRVAHEHLAVRPLVAVVQQLLAAPMMLSSVWVSAS